MLRVIIAILFVAISLFAGETPNGSPSVDKLNALIKGNIEFANDGQKSREQVKGKTPDTIVLSCSDFPLSAESVFDQGLGSIYSIKNAGHIADSATIASIEHAVQNLGVKLLVIMGHESCGAVRTAITAAAGQSMPSKQQNALVATVRNHLQSFRMLASNDAALRPPVSVHVAGTAIDLLKRSQIIKKAAEDGTLLIAEGIYGMESGKVELLRVGRTSSQGLDVPTPEAKEEVEPKAETPPQTLVLKKKKKVLPKVVEKHEEENAAETEVAEKVKEPTKPKAVAEKAEEHKAPERAVASKVEAPAKPKVEEPTKKAAPKVESESAWGE